MERKQKMSVPQFGGWDHKPTGVPTDYSMVFNQARENKKNHRTDYFETRRLGVGNDQRGAPDAANHRHGARGPRRNQPRHAPADPPVMKKPVKMSVPQFGAWEHKPKDVPTDYSLVFNQARENKKNHKTYLTQLRRLSSIGIGQRVAPKKATNHHNAHISHGPRHNPYHRAHQDPPVMGKRNPLTYMSCCTGPWSHTLKCNRNLSL